MNNQMANNSIRSLYARSLMVRLTNSKLDERFKSIHITVEYQTTTVPTHKTELIIKLTDELDPFFLYSLYMNEDDYQTLKADQGLLVDFGAFGDRFIELLSCCEKDEKNENLNASSKFQLVFFTREPLPYDHGNAQLKIVEINSFKQLSHLTLNFMPGNDTDVKKYLATCLRTIRENYNQLSKVYDETKESLSKKLEKTQQVLSEKTNEIDKLKLELESQSTQLLNKHMAELTFEREKLVQNQFAIQQNYETEKKELSERLNKNIRMLESRVSESEVQLKDLTKENFKNEGLKNELTAKNKALQDELENMRNELTDLRKRNIAVDSELHNNEKTANQLRTRIAVLEQELKDKVDTLNRTQELLTNEQSQHKKLEDMYREKCNELKKRQSEINHYVQEFKKGNDVVTKLQEREKTLVNQIKLKSRVMTEQEKVIKDKEKEVAEIAGELREIKQQTNMINDENKELKNSLQKRTQELEEATKIIKKDEAMINWLNRQITDNKLGGAGGQNSFEQHNHHHHMNGYSNGPVFKPVGTLLSNNTLGSASTTSLNMNGLNSNNNNLESPPIGTIRLHSSNSATTTTNGYLNKSDMPDSSTRRLIMQQHQHNHNMNQQKGALSSSSGSSMQNDTHKENQEMVSPTLSQRMSGSMSDNGKNSSNGSSTTNRLDPKYFQSNSPNITNGMDLVSIRPQMMRLGLSTASSNTNGTSNSSNLLNRLANGNGNTNTNNNTNAVKQVQYPPQSNNHQQTHNQVAIFPTSISSKSTPSLASAYFPNAN